MSVPATGDIVLIGAAASVQFAGDRALRLRISAVNLGPTYHGWIWLTGYVLDKRGRAVDRREVYVQAAGIEILTADAGPARRAAGESQRRGLRSRHGSQH
uniref:hypothetical protein n=1 Tax=Micromonospora acroterricola TaxID=2202421 RepID=UPI001F1CCD7D|nr:hypothetical protein [Micromonospora acroterricola]